MARLVRQPLPEPPAVYDQAYLAKLVNAVNQFMFQVTAQAEIVSASYICTAPVLVDPTGQRPNSVPNTVGLPTGTFYIFPRTLGTPDPPGTPGAFYVSIVTEQDQ